MWMVAANRRSHSPSWFPASVFGNQQLLIPETGQCVMDFRYRLWAVGYLLPVTDRQGVFYFAIGFRSETWAVIGLSYPYYSRHWFQRYFMTEILVRNYAITKPVYILTSRASVLRLHGRTQKHGNSSGNWNKYRPKWGDVLRLGSGTWLQDGSFEKVWAVHIKLCDPLLTRVIPEHRRDEQLIIEY